MNKVCVITGAGGVLCSSFAQEMAKNGYAVALLNRHEEPAAAVADRICTLGGLAKAYKADVLDREMLENVHRSIQKEVGPCTVLINGAGGNAPGATTAHEYFESGDEDRDDIITLFNMESKAFDDVLDLNIKGALLTTQVFAPDMIGRSGCSIINVTSMNAFRPLTKIPAYSAAKAGLANLTQWLAVHFAKEGIRVNAIAPGFFSTNQNKALLWNEDGTPTQRSAKILAATPMGRFGEPEELLGALRFLADPDMSGFVTGTTITVDGGFSAYSGV